MHLFSNHLAHAGPTDAIARIQCSGLSHINLPPERDLLSTPSPSTNTLSVDSFGTIKSYRIEVEKSFKIEGWVQAAGGT